MTIHESDAVVQVRGLNVTFTSKGWGPSRSVRAVQDVDLDIRPGTTLGVAISGTVIGPALARGGAAFTSAAHGVWWMTAALGAGIVILWLVSTRPWAARTAVRAASS